MKRRTRLFILTRRFLSRAWDKNFLVFLFFLLLSGSFWLFLALGDEYEKEFSVNVRLRGVPENVVITTELPSSFRIVLKDNGSQLLNYEYGGLPVVNVDFKNYDQRSGHVVLSMPDITKSLLQKLPATTKVVSYKPERLEYYFNNGLNVRLPVVLNANLKPAGLYGISSVKVKPDSVTVYATHEVLDTMLAVYTEQLYAPNITESQAYQVALSPVRGAKFVPNRVTVQVKVDQMTEKTVNVPIKWVNFPATKRLRTFPAKVKIIFQVGMSSYRKLTAEDFTLVLNYEDLLKEKDGNVQLSLKSLPVGASHVRIVPNTVDFLIEDVAEEN